MLGYLSLYLLFEIIFFLQCDVFNYKVSNSAAPPLAELFEAATQKEGRRLVFLKIPRHQIRGTVYATTTLMIFLAPHSTKIRQTFAIQIHILICPLEV